MIWCLADASFSILGHVFEALSIPECPRLIMGEIPTITRSTTMRKPLLMHDIIVQSLLLL